VRIEPGEGATVVNKILAVVRPHDSPVRVVVDVIRLAAVRERYVEGPVDGDVVGTHGDLNSCRANGLVRFVSGQDSVPDRHVGAVTDIDESAIRRAMVSFAGDAVFESIYKNIGTPDSDAPAVVVVLRFGPVGNCGETSSPNG